MIKKAKRGAWYISFDPTVLHGYNVLLGFNYIVGAFSACRDKEMTDCIVFDYQEFQIGFLLFTISIGKEVMRPYLNDEENGRGDQDLQ